MEEGRERAGRKVSCAFLRQTFYRSGEGAEEGLEAPGRGDVGAQVGR